jgi:hypothetical protein
MGMSGQLDFLTALPQGKEHPVLNETEYNEEGDFL